MKKSKNFKKVIGGIMIGCMLLSLGVTSFANSVDYQQEGNVNVENGLQRGRFGQRPNVDEDMRENMAQKQEEQKEEFDNILSELVEEGIISQEKVDAINEYVEEKAQERAVQLTEERTEERAEGRRQRGNMERGQKQGILEEMVEEGIITSEEAEAIKDKQEETMIEKREELINSKLESLVEDGTITEDDIDLIIEYMDEQREEKREEMEAIKDMTEEERKEYFEENKTEKTDILSQMVEDGVLDEDKAEAIRELLPKANLHKQPRQGQGGTQGARPFNRGQQNDTAQQ